MESDSITYVVQSDVNATIPYNYHAPGGGGGARTKMRYTVFTEHSLLSTAADLRTPDDLFAVARVYVTLVCVCQTESLRCVSLGPQRAEAL